MKFNTAQTKIAARIYQKGRIPLDQLPYTENLEQMFAEFCHSATIPKNPKTGKFITIRDFWIALITLRKAGKLGRLEKSAGK